MKKQAIVGAVLGVMSGMAVAQGAAPSTGITIYGVADAGVLYAASPLKDQKVSAAQLGSGNFYGSRLGFKGTEDLGGGLNAHFVLEAGYDLSTGEHGEGNLLFNRQALVGLGGGFGKLTMGRQYNSYDNVTGAVDPFANGLHGSMVNLFGPGYVARADNSLRYETPSLGGLTAAVLYGFGEIQGNNSKGRNAGVEIAYQGQGLYVGLAYQQTKSKEDPIATNDNLVLGGVVDLGVAKLHAAAGQTKIKVAGVHTNAKNTEFMLGTTLPFGAHAIMASFIMAKGSGDFKGQQFGLGYTYDFSKRTSLYVSAANVSNKGGAEFVTLGGGQRGAGVGIKHSF